MKFEVKTNVLDIQDILSDVAREQLPYASAAALTEMAKLIQKKELEVVGRVFDRPTPWTMNSLFIEPAKKQDWPKPVAQVYFKDFAPKGTAADAYLQPHVFGGTRKHKRSEKALIARGIMKSSEYTVPGAGAQLDAFGNIKRGDIVKILSDLRAFSEVGFNANRTQSKRSQTAAKKSGYIFAVVGGQRGIYRKRQTVWGTGLTPILLFVEGAPRYRKRFAFFEIATNVMAAHYDDIFGRNLAKAIATSKKPGKPR